MNCKETEENLEAFLDGELPRQVRKEIGAHLKVCPRCRESWREAMELRKLLRSLPSERCPSAVEDKVWAEIPLGKGKYNVFPLLPRWAKATLAAAALIGLALVGTHLHHRANPVYSPEQIAKGRAGVGLALAYYQRATQLSVDIIKREAISPLKKEFDDVTQIFIKRRKL